MPFMNVEVPSHRVWRRLDGLILVAIVVAACGESHSVADTGADSDVDVEIAGLAVGRDHMCAWTEDGRAYCWGDNRCGQVGDGTITNRTEPVELPGLEGVVGMFAASCFSCAWDAVGAVKCWGYHRSLGPSAFAPRRVPELGDVVDITAADIRWPPDSGVCATHRDGSLLCWSELDSAPERPETFRDLDVVGLASGSFDSGVFVDFTYCARARDGSLHCGGFGDFRLDAPVERYLEDVSHLVAAGVSFGCVERTGVGLQCWRGDIAYEPVEPRLVEGFDDFVGYSGNDVRVCGWSNDGRVRCIEEALEALDAPGLSPAIGVAVGDRSTTCAWTEGRMVVCKDHLTDEISEFHLPADT